jgi:hypothetical protein
MIFLNKFPTVISRHLPFRYTSSRDTFNVMDVKINEKRWINVTISYD